MKQIPVFIITSLILVSCSNTTQTKIPGTPAIDSSALFLQLFADIDPNNLHVYSPCDTIGGNKFEGKQIAGSLFRFLETKEDNISTTNAFSNYYSCYKFKISNTKTGLIVRAPSQYSSSAVELYTWDNMLKKVIVKKTLADTFGDEGWFFVQDAWLQDLDNDTHIDIITRRKDYDMDMDDSNKITKTDSIFVFIGKDIGFKQKAISIDTGKFQLYKWLKN